MGEFAASIARASRRTRAYAEKLVAGITPEMAARVPVIGGVTIQTNHASFLFGHLSLYPARIAKVAGVSGEGLSVPEPWDGLFKVGAPCVDDPRSGQRDGHYPVFADVRDRFFETYDAVVTRIEGLDDAVFARVNPEERYREAFPTVGPACLFLLNNHVAMHMGQLSAWRRCMGLGSIG